MSEREQARRPTPKTTARRLLFVRLCVVAFALASLSPHARAQATASVRGRVTDRDGAAVAGASVEALNAASGRVASARTDASGAFLLEHLSPGEYRVRADAAGFSALTLALSLRASETAGAQFVLEPGTLSETVNVTAGRGRAHASRETPQPVAVVAANEIEERRPASVLGAIERTPNLSAVGANPVGARPRLRGLASNRLLLVLDGDRLNNVRSDPLSGVSPGVIDVTQLHSAEVVSGGGSSLYGSDAVAGVINLLTKAPAPPGGGRVLALRLDTDLRANGPFRRGSLTLNWSTPRVALRVNGSQFRAADYRAGDSPVALEDVVRFGRFLNELGNASGNNVARTYAVWALPEGARVPNGQGHGFNDQLDLWLFPAPRHSLRFRQLNSQHKQLGFPLLAAPFDPRNQFNGFRRLDKHGARYEAWELTTWLSRLSANFYRQKYSFSDDNFVSTVVPGSSWDTAADPSDPSSTIAVLTGRASRFAPGNFTSGKSSVTSYGFDVQATFRAPFDALVTTGVSLLRDSSSDEFARLDFSPGGAALAVSGRASNPDAAYTNLGWFNFVEYEPRPWLRLTGGLRVDRWTTRATPTPGFPLSAEAAVLEASFAQLAAAPGPVNLEGVRGVFDLIGGGRPLRTSNTVVTENLGVVLRLPFGLGPYLRWGNTYREPGITERYILRDFGDPTFSVLVVPNTALRPERGDGYEAGVKLSRRRFNASLGYFRNDLKDFLRPVFSGALFVPADAARGLQPLSPFFPFHGVLYVQRANTARARVEGWEADFEVSLPLGHFGTLSPFGTLGLLEGSDLTPDASAVALIERFYNRADTPVALRGSASDAPLAAVTPSRGVFGLRYLSARGRWFAEYETRRAGRVTRADPLELSAAVTTQYGTLASLSPFTTHALRAGHTFRAEGHRTLLTLGLENMTDRFYFEHFVNAPAPGRTLVFGVTTEFFNLAGK